MMKKILFLTIAMMLVLSACAPQAAAPAAQPTATQAAAAPAGEKVELRVWMHQNQAFINAYQVLFDAYMKENPNVTIKVETFEYSQYIQTLQTAMPAGQEADVMQMFGSWVCGYADRLTPAAEGELAAAQKIFYKATLDGFTCNGKLYGYPQEFNIEFGGVLVNKKMFTDAGLAYPPKWKNWDELIADAQKLTKTESGAMKVAGFDFIGGDALPFQLMAGILQRGGNYMNGDGTAFTWNSPQAKEVVEWMDSMVKKDKVVDPKLFSDANGDSGTTFFQGQSAIAYIGPWAVSLGKTNYPDFGEFDYVATPYLGDKPFFAADAGWGLTVSPHTKNQAEAWKLIKYITMNSKNALSWTIGTTTVPALVENSTSKELLDKTPWLSVDFPLLPSGRYIGYWPDRDQVFYNIVYTHLLNVFTDVETVDAALKAMDDESNATFKK